MLLGMLLVVIALFAPSTPTVPYPDQRLTKHAVEQNASSNLRSDVDVQTRLLTECANREEYMSQYRIFIAKGYHTISEFHVVLMCLIVICLALQGLLVLNRRLR